VKIEKRLIVFFMFVSILSVLAMAAVGYVYTKSKMTEGFIAEMRIFAEGSSRDIENWLLRKSDMVVNTETMLRNVVGNGEFDSSHLSHKQNDPTIEMLYVGLEDMRVIADNNWQPPVGYDPRGRPWYIDALQKNALIYSDPYVDVQTNQYVVTVSMPFRNNTGQIRGVVAADILLSSLTDSVKNINIDGHGFAFLLDRSGIILTHPDTNLVTRNVNEIESLRKNFTELMTRDNGIIDYFYKGEENLLAYKRIPLTGWVICVAVPKKVIFESLSSLTWIFAAVSLLMIIISFIIALFMSKRFTKPITALTTTANMIASGDLRMRAKVQGNDEITELTKAFNRMSNELNTLIQKTYSFVSVSYQTAQDMKAASLAAEQILTEMTMVTSASDTQLHSIQHGVSLVSDMDNMVNDIATYISSVAKETDMVKQAVDSGLTAVEGDNVAMQQNIEAFREVSTSINLLDNKSKEVGTIVEIISSISEQTNLLALNAAIEAARAGQHGLGFAVVAEEVRKLSEQTGVSSKQIVELIMEIQVVTKELVKKMNKATETMHVQEDAVNVTKESFGQIHRVADTIVIQIHDVVSDIRKLHAGMKEIYTMINDIAGVAQESVAKSQEMTASASEQMASIKMISKEADELVSQTKNLEAVVGRYKVL